MEVVAKLKGARMSAQKARLVADQIRGKSVESALEILQFSTKKGADIIKKVLEDCFGQFFPSTKCPSMTSDASYKYLSNKIINLGT